MLKIFRSMAHQVSDGHLSLKLQLALNEVIDGLSLQYVHLSILNGSPCELSSFGRRKAKFGQLFENCTDDSFGSVEMQLEKIFTTVTSPCLKVDHHALVDQSFLRAKERPQHHLSRLNAMPIQYGLPRLEGSSRMLFVIIEEREDSMCFRTANAHYLNWMWSTEMAE